MEDTLRRLIEIEQLASSIMESSTEEIQKLDEAHLNKLRKLDEQSAKEYEDTLLKIDKELELSYLSRLTDMQNSTSEEIRNLKAHYEAKHTEYVDELFNSFIEV